MEMVGKVEDVSSLNGDTKEQIVEIIENEMDKGTVPLDSLNDLIVALESFAGELSEAEAEDALDLTDVEEALEKK